MDEYRRTRRKVELKPNGCQGLACTTVERRAVLVKRRCLCHLLDSMSW
jgi:hypothetical protein